MKINVKNNLIYFNLFLIIMLFFAQLSLRIDNHILLYFSFVSILLLSAVSSKKSILLIFLFLLVDNNIFDFQGISIQYFIMIIYLFKFVFIKLKFDKKLLFWSVLFFLYSIIYYKYGGISSCIQGIKLAIMIYFFTCVFLDKDIMNIDTYKESILYACKGIFYSILIAIIVNPSLLDSSRFSLSSDSNWNLLGIFSAIIFSHLFILWYKLHDKKTFFYLSISFVCSLLSTSRTALLLLIISILWVLFFFNSTKKYLTRNIFIVLFGLLFVLLIYLNAIHITYLDKIIDRIINPRRGDISNGRFLLWSSYINYLKNNRMILLLGYGSPLINDSISLYNGLNLVAHNMFIEQLVMYGIIGNMIIFRMFRISYCSIKSFYFKTKSFLLEKKYIILILLVFISGFFSHILTSVLVTTELYLGIYGYLVHNNGGKENG